MSKEIDYEYDVKCRKCGNITRTWFGSSKQTLKVDFRKWVSEHGAFPVEKQCKCDNGMMMLHDIVSFGNILDVF